jgi:HEAT repeat protein
MKNRLYLVLGILLVAALGVLWWAPWEPREPVYEGKTVSYWIRHPHGTPSPLALPVNGPILLYFRIGRPQVNPSLPQFSLAGEFDESIPPPGLLNDSNAVPFLIRALKGNMWVGQKCYGRWVWPKLPSSVQRYLPPPDNIFAREQAAVFLGRMGPIAKPAIPALVRVLREDDALMVREYAAFALGELGKGDTTAIAALTKALNDEGATLRVSATNALKRLGPEAAAKAGVKKPSP